MSADDPRRSASISGHRGGTERRSLAASAAVPNNYRSDASKRAPTERDVYLCRSRMRATCSGRTAAGSAVLDVIVEDYISDFACRCRHTGKPHPDADSRRQGYRATPATPSLGSSAPWCCYHGDGSPGVLPARSVPSLRLRLWVHRSSHAGLVSMAWRSFSGWRRKSCPHSGAQACADGSR